MKHSSEAGYTLTELLVVLVILGLLAAAITPRVIGRLDKSKVKAAKLQLETLSASVDSFYIDLGRYPSEEEGLDALMFPVEGVEGWDGPYIRAPKNLIDPWRNRFLYQLNSNKNGFLLKSLGRDGELGGDGQNSDLVYPDFSVEPE